MDTQHSRLADTENPDSQYCIFCPLCVPTISRSASESFSTEAAHLDTNYENSPRLLGGSMPPIEMLPDEILLEIFACCVWASRDPSLKWFNFSWVSHRWRSIALSKPSLWSRPDFSHGTEMIRTMLARAINTPIYLHMTEHTQHNHLSVLRLASHVQSKLKELTILYKDDGRREDPKRPPLDEITDLPIAEVIHVSLDRYVTFQTGTLKINFAPRLTELKFHDCSFEITDHSRIQALVSLSIRYPSYNSSLSLSKLLKMLSTNPNLRSLSLAYAIEWAEGLTNQAPARLPYLEECILADDSHKCATILEYISTSRLSHVNVFCRVNDHQLTPNELHMANMRRVCYAAVQRLAKSAESTISLRVHKSWDPVIGVCVDVHDNLGVLVCRVVFETWYLLGPTFLPSLLTLGLHALHLDTPFGMDGLCDLISLPRSPCILRVTFRTGIVRILEAIDTCFYNTEHEHSADRISPFEALEIVGVAEKLEWPLEATVILEKWRDHGFPFLCRIVCKDKRVCEAVMSQLEDRILEMVEVVVDGPGRLLK